MIITTWATFSLHSLELNKKRSSFNLKLYLRHLNKVCTTNIKHCQHPRWIPSDQISYSQMSINICILDWLPQFWFVSQTVIGKAVLLQENLQACNFSNSFEQCSRNSLSRLIQPPLRNSQSGCLSTGVRLDRKARHHSIYSIVESIRGSHSIDPFSKPIRYRHSLKPFDEFICVSNSQLSSSFDFLVNQITATAGGPAALIWFTIDCRISLRPLVYRRALLLDSLLTKLSNLHFWFAAFQRTQMNAYSV